MSHYKDNRRTEQIKGEFRHSIKFKFEILYLQFEIPQCVGKFFNGCANLFEKKKLKIPPGKGYWIGKGDQNSNISHDPYVTFLFYFSEYLFSLEIIHTHICTLCIWIFTYIYTHRYAYLRFQINTSICSYVYLYIYRHIMFMCGTVHIYIGLCVHVCTCVCACVCWVKIRKLILLSCSLDMIYHTVRIIKDMYRLLSLCTYPKLFPKSIFPSLLNENFIEYSAVTQVSLTW